MYRILCLIAAMMLLLLTVDVTDACSCAIVHPQESYCNSNYVIVARVKRAIVKDNSKMFKIRIKRTFKISNNKTLEALQTGILWTAKDDAMCGTDLNVNKTYLIAGNVISGRPRVSLCNYIKPWETVTSKQRKGFRLLYKPTCNVCDIIYQHWSVERQEAFSGSCLWTTKGYPGYSELPDCQALYGICTKQPSGECGWTSDRFNQECMKARQRMSQYEFQEEP